MATNDASKSEICSTYSSNGSHSLTETRNYVFITDDVVSTGTVLEIDSMSLSEYVEEELAMRKMLRLRWRWGESSAKIPLQVELRVFSYTVLRAIETVQTTFTRPKIAARAYYSQSRHSTNSRNVASRRVTRATSPVFHERLDGLNNMYSTGYIKLSLSSNGTTWSIVRVVVAAAAAVWRRLAF